MSRDTLYSQRFFCKKCKISQDIYIWISKSHEKQVHSCGTNLTPVFDEINEVPGIIVGKHAKGRSSAEKEKRRAAHFTKEILPTLSGSDRAYFEKKFKKKK